MAAKASFIAPLKLICVAGCEDRNECTDGSNLCDAKADCINNYGSYECECIKGYEYENGRSRTLEDKSEQCLETSLAINIQPANSYMHFNFTDVLVDFTRFKMSVWEWVQKNLALLISPILC